MKIGFVFDDSLDNPDGVQQYILTLGAWLSKQGHEVHYIVGQTARRDLDNVHSLSQNVAVRFNKNRVSIPLPVSANKLRRFLAQHSFDVLHVQVPYSPQFAARIIACAPPKTAIIGTFHILPFGKLQQAGTKVLRALLASSLRRFDAMVAVSPAAQVFAKQSMHLDTVVVPNAVDLSLFNNSARQSRQKNQSKKIVSIVFLGRLVPRKGCLQLLQALDELQKQNKLSGIKVTIAGSGQQAGKLQEYARAHALDEVTFVGQQTEDQKTQLLASADIVVLPSLAGESFGIVVVEAIAAGSAVVIGGDNPGYRYVLGATPETIINPLQARRFAEKIHQLADNEALRNKYRSLQQQHITQFDVEVVGKQIMVIYTDALRKHGKV